MRLTTKIIIGLSAAVFITILGWGTAFYFSLMRELNNDLNRTLTNYSNDIIVDHLYGVDEDADGVPGPAGAYSSTMREVTADYALSNNQIDYWDSVEYIPSQNAEVPARNRKCIFIDSQDVYYELIVSVPTFTRDSVFEHILKLVSVLYLVILISIIVIAFTLVRYNLKPLESLIQWFERYSDGKADARTMPVDTQVVEFARLSKVANTAVERLERRNEEQKAFVGNVSHELQTPLASCIGRVDMLLDDPDLTEHQAVELSKVSRSLSDTARLNKTLLTLYRVENDQFPDKEQVNFTELIKDSAEFYNEIYGYKDIHAEVVDAGAFIHEANLALAKSLVGNLIKNAFVHSDKGTIIRIETGPDSFCISNDGKESLDADKIFQRFYRSSSDRTGSTGLGLALAWSICRHSDLTLTYSWTASRHHFTVATNNPESKVS